MSGHSNTARKARNEENKSEPQASDSTETSTTALNTANADRTVTVEIANLQVTLPLKFAPGHILTDNQAKILDAAYQRQFSNNMNANAKARSDRLAKATAANDAAAIAANQPYTAAEIAGEYTDYEPNVGGGPRMGSMEKMRHDAAWRAWVKLVGEHNDAIKAGGAPVITKAGSKPVVIASAPRKGGKIADGNGGQREVTQDDIDAFHAARDKFKAAMLTMPAYADRVQAELDAIMAERGASKAEPAAEAVTAGEDIL